MTGTAPGSHYSSVTVLLPAAATAAAAGCATAGVARVVVIAAVRAWWRGTLP
ncbi:hypothetical protein P3T37_003530 [Kitasatospora sp. MAA4]|uniref:hypothetical protein n=1 Tax=Kitasatospora sp. MAA4 TaxID=3035093 RepID=UPI002476C129|nr:hypothetical protein [Kitasatospora sp. MAA4]MDH6134128.1 hypothetical protein [Kitasatospora sp. MAA4]